MRLARILPATSALLALLSLPAMIAACDNSVTSPTSYSAFSQADLRLGTGTEAVAGKTVTVNYTGWLYDGSKGDKKGVQIDTSVGRATFTFTLGTGAVITGWDQGMVGMKVGGLRRLIVPPSLGYGAIRHGSIPPNATLVFEVELLDVQ